MGCDIHGYVEVNQNNGSWWASIIKLRPLSLRNYRFFSAFFGVRVRGDEDGIAVGRAFPDDYDKYEDHRKTMDEVFANDDYHSITWATFEELRPKWLEIFDQPFGYDKGWLLLYELCDKLERHYGVGKVRLVVWFDN